MARYSNRRIRDDFIRSDAAPTAVERGRILEELVAYLFSRCPGVRHYGNNILNAPGSSEIDVCFWNNGNLGVLDFLPQILVAECKNNGGRVGSQDVRVFEGKLRDAFLDYGILVAANGITGDAQNLRAAHDIIRQAFIRDQRRILVLTKDEIENLNTTDGLVTLLQDKILLLTMQAQTFRG